MFKQLTNFLSLVETAEILADDELMERLKRGSKQSQQGKYSDISDVKKRLGL